jgi:hypothetical protein
MTGVKHVISPEERSFYTASDLSVKLGISMPKAYGMVRTLRNELIESGRLVKDYPAGKVPKEYANERCMIT